MEESTKLALAVVVAAVILVGGYVGYREWSRSRDIDEAQQALDAFHEQSRQIVDDSRRVAQAAAQQQASYQWHEQERRRLLFGQRCVAGAVVQVEGNTYTQLGTISQPIHCSGVYADQPLR